MQKPLAIALVGAAGRMGLEIARAARARGDLRIVSAVERQGAVAVGSDLGEIAGAGASGVIVGEDLVKAFESADVAIDLSLPEATSAVVAAAKKTKTPLVLGTTGIDEAALTAIDEASKDIPILYTPNLSPGIAVAAALVEHAVKALGPGYDIEIIETHHRNKKDAPSGTALTLAQAAARSRGLNLTEASRLGRSGQTGMRPENEIGIHAVRAGGVFGDHTVVLASEHERIEITHRASSRALFAEGALRAALVLVGKPPGRYTMADIVGSL
jgi:4-hydroxy-tetrahydrodipicolinate reductase